MELWFTIWFIICLFKLIMLLSGEGNDSVAEASASFQHKCKDTLVLWDVNSEFMSYFCFFYKIFISQNIYFIYLSWQTEFVPQIPELYTTSGFINLKYTDIRKHP